MSTAVCTSVANSVTADSVELDRNNIRVMIVDDHPMVRLGIRAGLEQIGGLAIECEAEEGAAALELAVSHTLDVAIIDIRMPDMDGIEIAACLRERFPHLRIVLISGYFDTVTIERSVEVGAHALVLKTERPHNLAKFVRQAVRGEYCCSESVRELVEPHSEGFRFVAASGPRLSDLSPRERALLGVLSQGVALKTAAGSLGISYKAADHLKQNLMKKLGVHDRVELASFAFREGISS